MHRLFNLPTTDLSFSPGLQKALYEAGAEDIGELIRHSEHTLRRWRGLGPKRIEEIKQRLTPLGLSLGTDPLGGDAPPLVDLLALSMERDPGESSNHRNSESRDISFSPCATRENRFGERIPTAG